MGEEETRRIHATHLCEFAGKNYGAAAIPLLVDVLEDETPVVREGAVIGLALALADTIACLAMHGGEDEPSPGVRAATRDALEDIADAIEAAQQKGLGE